MTFILFMIVLALFVILVFWLVFRPGSPQPAKKPKPSTKKVQRAIASKPAPLPVTGEQLRNNAMKLLKKNPEVVSKVVKQWLRGG